MMKRMLRVAAVALLMTGAAIAESEKVSAEELKQVLEKNFSASGKEDVEMVMATLHPDSQAYSVTSETLESLFEKFDLNFELISFSFIGQDGDYAVGRAVQKTTKVKGPDFSNNKIDSIYVFKKADDGWRLWSQVMLETELLK